MPESYLKGLVEIAAIDPDNGSLFVEELKDFSPDFAEYFVGFAFGQIHGRNVLETRVKELITIASLVALGDAKSHLRLRIMGALRLGCTKDEIIEVIIQSVVHVGFTRATAALNLIREVCEDNAKNESKEPAKSEGSPPSPIGIFKKARKKSGVQPK